MGRREKGIDDITADVDPIDRRPSNGIAAATCRLVKYQEGMT